MPRTRSTTNPWEPELLRLGRRLLRGAVQTGTEIAIGGLDSIESAISHAVTSPREGRRLRLVGASGSGTPDCLADE
jgi:hypothetical protein